MYGNTYDFPLRGTSQSSLASNAIPVLVNIIFVVIAQTLLFVFVLSRLFKKSVNAKVNDMKKCVETTSLLVVDGDVTSKMSPEAKTRVIDEYIQPMEQTPIKDAFPTLKKSGMIVIVLLFLLFVIMFFSKQKKDIGTFILFAMVGYITEIVFLFSIVFPYEHIDEREVILEVTDI